MRDGVLGSGVPVSGSGIPGAMQVPTRKDGMLDLDADWKCEFCGKIVPLRETCLSWALNIICEDCHKEEEE